GPAAAQCVYPALTSGSPLVIAAPGDFLINQADQYWTAIGVRSNGASNWDMAHFAGTAVFPVCVSGPLATSAQAPGTVDLGVGDFNAGHNATGVTFLGPSRLLGFDSAALEWDA